MMDELGFSYDNIMEMGYGRLSGYLSIGLDKVEQRAKAQKERE